jgi:TM2 domain-containing membrane protein YozV
MAEIMNGILIGIILFLIPSIYRLRQEAKWNKVEQTWEYINARMEEDDN